MPPRHYVYNGLHITSIQIIVKNSTSIIDRFQEAQNSLVIQQSDFSLAVISEMVEKKLSIFNHITREEIDGHSKNNQH